MTYLNHSTDSLRHAAKASDLIYLSESQLRAVYFNADVEFFDQNECQAAVISHHHLIIVVFRGTDSIMDWITNAEAYRIAALKGGKVHFGFKSYSEEVGKQLFDAMTRMWDREQKILVTGHSLGGVAATIWCSEWLRGENHRVEHITFGSPRPGDADFANQFDAEFGHCSLRVTNGADLVPHVPTAFPKWADFLISKVWKWPVTPGRYRHAVKKHLHFTTDGKILKNPGKCAQWRDFFAGLWADFGIKGLAGIKAHDMKDNYRPRVGALP